ncbi:MAG: siderophore biosynthesis protein [Leptolyngbya sp. SIO4C5]|nr:siderophore biosynthesis protein [Leptolyngbya sp. SIO4C5]
MANLNSYQIWKGFHWSFFINIQGLIICLRRFEENLLAGSLSSARIELETAAELMLASGAAMELAGSFSRQAYEHQVRPSMMPPQVRSSDFSGLMSWEHAALVQIWKRLQPIFATLPPSLKPQHEQFVQAYLSLAASHGAVCQKFGGETIGSLRCENKTAIQVLDKFKQRRQTLIDPNSQTTGCPMHPPVESRL